MKKIAVAFGFFVGASLLAIVYLKAYRDGRCEYAVAKYAEAKESILAQQDEMCFTVRARLGGEDTVLADKICKKWLSEKVEPEVDAYFAEELKKDSCN